MTDSTKIVVQLFAKTERPAEEWKGLREAVVTHVNYLINGYEGPSSLSARFLDQASEATAGRVVEVIANLNSHGKQVETLSLRQCKNITNDDWFQKFSAANEVEIILQPYNLYVLHKKPGLAVFDMDSTLIQQEVIDELARAVGLYDQVAAITEAAMRGEEPYTDFEASLRARVALLKGVPNSIWEKMKREIITFTPGAHELLRTLKKLGWKAAVLSGGFIPLAMWVKETLGLDYAYANHLVSDPALEQLTGELVGEAPIIHGQKKRELLLQLAKENGIPTEQVIAVGDGSNDLPMMEVAGLGIAFNAKPKVQLAAPSKLNSKSLSDVLYILGYSKEEIDTAAGS
ncbi:Phosphoserine phosphatase [Lecanosticta acicola]|uniref:phosphoserine phosphatase n=1 Tax=Lecanosticta acicola TaxID=111012 RepID=A0AAI8YRM0_9PEZI|nr:Phosphoserine phosphatase [Lecanosticta acicola]